MRCGSSRDTEKAIDPSIAAVVVAVAVVLVLYLRNSVLGGLARGAYAENFMDFASLPRLADLAASAAVGVWMGLGTIDPPLPVFFAKYFSGLSFPVSLL